MSNERKPIREMTSEERNEYNRKRYEERVKGSSKIVLEISNCPEDLMNAILAAIKEGK